MVIADARQMLTCASDTSYDVAPIEHGWMAITGETIAAVGDRAQVEAAVDCSEAQIIAASGCVVAPGFVDSHTHLVFGWSRVDEYAAKMTESDPEVVRQMGIKTGILATVQRTRAAAIEELVDEAAIRLRRRTSR